MFWPFQVQIYRGFSFLVLLFGVSLDVGLVLARLRSHICELADFICIPRSSNPFCTTNLVFRCFMPDSPFRTSQLGTEIMTDRSCSHGDVIFSSLLTHSASIKRELIFLLLDNCARGMNFCLEHCQDLFKNCIAIRDYLIPVLL